MPWNWPLFTFFWRKDPQEVNIMFCGWIIIQNSATHTQVCSKNQQGHITKEPVRNADSQDSL